MRGLTSIEREALVASTLPDSDWENGGWIECSSDELAVIDRLEKRGCVRARDVYVAGELIGQVYDATELGRLALSVCSVDGKFSTLVF